MQRNVEPGKHLIDLKQSFACSPHRKLKASGGWYTVIQIGLPYNRGRKAYGSKPWNIPIKGNYGTYNGLALSPNTVSCLSYNIHDAELPYEETRYFSDEQLMGFVSTD